MRAGKHYRAIIDSADASIERRSQYSQLSVGTGAGRYRSGYAVLKSEVSYGRGDRDSEPQTQSYKQR